MKIAYVLNSYPQPSQSFIRREITALEAQGHEVLRIAMRPGTAPLVDAQDQAEAARTAYVLQQGKGTLARALLRALAGVRHRGGRDALRAAGALARQAEPGNHARHLAYLAEAAHVMALCRSEGVAHIHAHFGTNAAAVALLARLMGGPPYSFTVHGPEEFDAPRALSLGRKIHHAAFVAAISSFGRSQLCRWADPQDWDRIKIVHCGIEPEKFAAPQPLPEGPRRLVAIGRLVEQKGQLALIDALARGSHALPLTLIGDGPLRPALEARIAALGLGDRVTLAGWQDEAQIRAALDAAHGLVMPSFAEGLPMVVMEAMAAARPVIATQIAGTPELLRHGREGWLVPASDATALAAAIDALAEAPLVQLAQMGARGRDRVLERHDATREAARLADHIAAAQSRPTA